MSILNRLTSNAHLDESALAAAWTDGRLDGGQAAHPHLAACAACRARLADLSAWLEEIRVEAVREADEAFPAERLAAQQAQIAWRLETAGRPARVIAFPRLSAPIAAGSSSVRRWVASAAAAGLIAGVALGNFMDLRHGFGGWGGARTPDIGLAGSLQATISDEELMWHLEEAASPRMPDALTAFDSQTPRARDYPR